METTKTQKKLSLNDINTTTQEGRFLLAAIAIITTECRTDKHPDLVLEEIKERADFMFRRELSK